jgi:hypothetical protein
VTSWSKLGTSFGGVSVDLLLDAAEPLGAYAMVYSDGGYTTNLTIDDLTDGKAWVVTEHEGEPLERAHGGPARLVVPHLYLMAMMRHRRRTMPDSEMELSSSARSAEELIYADELNGDVTVTLTREAPEGWTGPTGRINADLIARAAADARIVFICGSNGFVEAASSLALELGVEPRMIRTERFGPTG